MNKNTTIGLLLIGLILFGFSWYNNRQYAEAKKEQARIDSIAAANMPRNPVASVAELSALDNAANALNGQNDMGVVAPKDYLSMARSGSEQFYTLENSVMKVIFSNKGGRVASVELNDYKRYNGDSLSLFTADGSTFGMTMFAPEQINTADYYFEPVIESSEKISFRLYADSSKSSYLEYVYQIKPDDYMMDMNVNLSNFKGRLAQNQATMGLNWNIVSPQEEKGFQNENNYTTVAYKYPNATDIEELGMSDGTKSQQINTKVEWVAFKQQFFSSIIINRNNFSDADIKFDTYKPNSGNIKDFSARLSMPYNPQMDGYDFNLYFGPNKFSVLKDYEGLELQKLVPLGWGIFGWINRWLVIPTFDFFGKYIANFGIVILLLTVFIKLLIFPLTYKSYLSSAKMRLLKPDMLKISEKYPRKEDAMKKQQAIMELYKSAGVNPMGGCLPMLIQFPILIAMFRFFPAAIELRGKSFLWADDLSSYDSIWTFPDGFSLPFYGDHVSLFTILMAISLYVSSRINFAQNSMGNDQQMPGMKFMMLYMMPIMMLLWFNNYSSGLSYYYLLSNIITIGQTYAFRYMVSDTKLHAKMKANAKKPVKKSKWAERLEAMQKAAAAQQAAQHEQQKNKK